MDVAEVFAWAEREGGPWATYERRPGQLAMAEAVARAFRRERPLFVEAGTGTGKTLAYLLPALLSGRRVVVSTATKALQDQLRDKDIPLALRLYGDAHGLAADALPKVRFMKGLGNYICKRRFAEWRRSDPAAPARKLLPMLVEWEARTETGDRSELPDIGEDAAIWRDIVSSTDTRIGASCTFYDGCWVTKMRQEAENADVIVVNHHLFLADLALRTGKREGYASVLPPYDAVVFDEAHQLADIATDFFGTVVSSGRIEAIVRDAARTLEPLGEDLPSFVAVLSAAKHLFDLLSHGSTGEGRRALGPGEWTPEAARACQALLDALCAMESEVERVAHTLRRSVGGAASVAADGPRFDALTSEAPRPDAPREEAVLLIARRARDVRADLESIARSLREAFIAANASAARAAVARPDVALDDEEAGPREPGAPIRDDDGAERAPEPGLVWIEARERSTAIGESPVDVGSLLRERLFDRVPAIICTSATLTVRAPAGGVSFGFTRHRIGAPPEVDELTVDSPFDMAGRVCLYLPADLPEPSAPAFEGAAAERILDLLAMTGGGAFVLCTSTRGMRALYTRIAGRFKGLVLIQGSAPKARLVERFRQDGNAVLVATMSFWEGVDVPGRALRLVVIDKIPFAVPTDPLYQARAAHMEREGGNPFAQLAVPEAALTLKQGFGRLVRTASDAGVVALLDPRVVRRGYGKRILSTLPPATRSGTLDEVARFYARLFPSPGDASPPADATC